MSALPKVQESLERTFSEEEELQKLEKQLERFYALIGWQQKLPKKQAQEILQIGQFFGKFNLNTETVMDRYSSVVDEDTSATGAAREVVNLIREGRRDR